MRQAKERDIARSVAMLAALALAALIIAANHIDAKAATWKHVALPTDSRVLWLQTDADNRRTVYALIDDRNLVTLPTTWVSHSSGKNFTLAAKSPANFCDAEPHFKPACFRTRSGTRVLRWGSARGRLSLSLDSGRRFARVNAVPRGYFAAAAVDPRGQMVTAFKLNSPIPTMLSSVYFSPNSGRRWQQLQHTPRDVQAVAISGERVLLGGAAGLVSAEISRLR